MVIPFFSELAKGERFLIVGAGGGFDFIHGLPLYLYLTQTLNKKAIFSNYSFTKSLYSQESVFPGVYRVTKNAPNIDYFPEKYTAQWFYETLNIDIPIYAFKYGLGVQPLKKAYNHLIEKYQIDTLILIDGGTDSVIFGDEKNLGTIVEDATSMVAAMGANIKNKYLAAIGFGIDHFHGINHYNFLENVATLIKSKGYLGSFSLTDNMVEGQLYLSLTDYLNKHNNQKSIVNNSIANAMQGKFGDVHQDERTKGNELFINPLMLLFWTFTLESIVTRMEFSSGLENTHTIRDVIKVIEEHKSYRNNICRSAPPIPL